MNIGKLKEALPYYEKVMDKLAFQVFSGRNVNWLFIQFELLAIKKRDNMKMLQGVFYFFSVLNFILAM